MGFEALNLGHEISPQMSIDDQLLLSGLDWSVDASPLVSEFNGRLFKDDDVSVLRRSDTGERLTIVGDRWKPYSNRRFLTDFNNFCDRSGYIVERAGFIKRKAGLNKEAMAFASAVVPGSHDGELDLGNGDRSQMRIIFLNYFTYGKAIGGFVVNERIFCQNQLVLKVKDGTKQTIRHTANNVEGYDSILRVKGTLENVQKSIRNFWHISECLTRQIVTQREAVDFFIKHFGDIEKPVHKQPFAVQSMIDIYFDNMRLDNPNVDLAMNIETTKDTAYGVLNAVTAYETHCQGWNPQTGKANIGGSDRFLRSVASNSKSQIAFNSLARKYVIPSQNNQTIQTVGAF